MRALFLAREVKYTENRVEVSPWPINVKFPAGCDKYEAVADGGTLELIPRCAADLPGIVDLIRPGHLYCFEITEVETTPVVEDLEE
jgi:hypothetical protein